MKKTIAVIFGGKTCEHDISVITGLQLTENVDRSKYDVIPVYIDGDGRWYSGDVLFDADFYNHFDASVLIPVSLSIGSGKLIRHKKGIFAKDEEVTLDCIIPAMHGLNGEDGSLAGLCQLANIPFASSGVLGGAVGMDKILMKAAFIGGGLPVLEYVYFDRDDYFADAEAVLDRIESAVPYPVFVKPANLGSSIGISKAHDREELRRAIETATFYDRRILAERGVDKPIEINCSALGYGADVETSLCEQPIAWEEFLSFEDKYISGSKKTGAKGGMANLSRIIPAPISDDVRTRIEEMTVRAFKLLNCCGVVRIDYIIDPKDNALYINEINTMPGSMSYYLWDPKGVKYSALIDRMIECAMRAHADLNKNTYSFDSKVLKNYSGGKKGGTKSGGTKSGGTKSK